MALTTPFHVERSSRMTKFHLRSSIKLNGNVLKVEHCRRMGSIHTSCSVGPRFKPCFVKELSQVYCYVPVYPGKCRNIIYNLIRADCLIPLSRSIKTAIRLHRYILQAGDKFVKINKQTKTFTLQAKFGDITLEDHRTVNDLL
jgi:hypothetical protein